MYKINLHAHSRYSDGSNTIRDMALECKYLGFSACVMTDHVYRARMGRSDDVSLSSEKYEKALKEAYLVSADLNYPVILGAEFALGLGLGEEILVYGTEAIKYLLELRDTIPTVELGDLRTARDRFPCATIMAHPSKPEDWTDLDVLDGFEYCNQGAPQFNHRTIPENFRTLTPWSNSDAHSDYDLCLGWNYVDRNVIGEKTLIDLIKNHAPSKFRCTRVRNLNELFLESERQ
jgi:hypothetical protein